MESTDSGSRKEKSVSLRLLGLRRFVLFCHLLNCLCYFLFRLRIHLLLLLLFFFLRLPLHPFCLKECEIIHIWRQFVVTVAVPFTVNSLIINLDHQFVAIRSGSSLSRFFLRKRFYFIQSAFCNREQYTGCPQPHTSISTNIKKCFLQSWWHSLVVFNLFTEFQVISQLRNEQ